MEAFKDGIKEVKKHFTWCYTDAETEKNMWEAEAHEAQKFMPHYHIDMNQILSSFVSLILQKGWFTYCILYFVTGLFSVIMRDMSNITHDGPKWIVLDGDIDPMWIESLNTVMDDNKVCS